MLAPIDVERAIQVNFDITTNGGMVTQKTITINVVCDNTLVVTSTSASTTPDNFNVPGMISGTTNVL